MKEVAAYALCVLGGKANPSASDVKAVVQSVGGSVDNQAVKGKNLADILKEGLKQVGGLGAAGAAAAGAKGDKKDDKKKDEKKDDKKKEEKKKEEKKEEPVEEEMGCGDLFGDF